MKLHQTVRDVQVGQLVAVVLILGGVVGGPVLGGVVGGLTNILVLGFVTALLVIGLGLFLAYRLIQAMQESDKLEQKQDAEAIMSTNNVPEAAATALAKAHYFGAVPVDGTVWGPASHASVDGKSVTNYSLTYSNQNGYSVLSA